MTPKPSTLRGVLTALVTPMNRDGTVDFAALDQLVDHQLEAGIDGLVPCGTTGESATLTSEEREQVIGRVVKRVSGRVPVVAGAGANSTAGGIEQMRRVRGTGADFALVVTPYYNKPTPEGLVRHYAALVEAVDLPVVAYNVPGRTGCDLRPDTVARLAQLTKVVGIKEATGDLDRVSAIRAVTAAEFVLLSGDDGTACPFVWLGGHGVISVASNVAPQGMLRMVHAALDGKVQEARAAHEQLRPLFTALFLESNPIPAKAALAMQHRIQEVLRLPLCEMSAAPRAKLESVLRSGGWL